MNVLTLGLANLLVTATLGGTGIPMAIPPTPEDPALASAAPEDCLLYTSWAGIAVPDAKSENQTEQLLAEPEVQNFLTQMGRGFGNAFAATEGKDGKDSATATRLVFMCLNYPGAIFFSKPTLTKKPEDAGDERPKGEGSEEEKGAKPKGTDLSLFSGYKVEFDEFAFILSLGEDVEKFKGTFKTFIETIGSEAEPVEAFEIDGQTWWRKVPSDPVTQPTWGFHGKYFIMTNEKTRPKIIQRLKHDPPKWWSAVREQTPIERRSTVTYVNMQHARELFETVGDGEKKNDRAQVLEMLGLSSAKALVEVSGLEGEYFTTRTLLTLDGEPRRLLRLVSDKPLKAEDMAAIPRDSTLALAVRFDLQQAMDIVLAAVEKMGPDRQAEVKRILDDAERTLGMDLRHKVLGALGDTWCVYNSPGEGGFIFTGLTAVVPLRDKPAFSSAWRGIMEFARRRLDSSQNELQGAPATLETFRFEGYDVYCLNMKTSALAMAITEKEAVFALSPQNVKAYLSRGGQHEPIHRMPQVAKLFAGDTGPTMVYFSDTQRLFELFYPMMTFWAPAITEGMRQAKIDVDLSWMPSGASISRHLRPSLMTLRRSKYGLEMTTHNVIPMPGPMLILAMIGSAWHGPIEPKAAGRLLPSPKGESIDLPVREEKGDSSELPRRPTEAPPQPKEGDAPLAFPAPEA